MFSLCGDSQVGEKLLDELKALEPGQMLRITTEDGRRYGVLNWSDVKPGNTFVLAEGEASTQCAACGLNHGACMC